MASYDSDSSDGEFDETNVLLGYASKEADDDTISKLGGRPDWLEPENAPSAALARCKACGNLMALVMQLNAELPEKFPGHDRRLYVFACTKASCRRKDGSIRAVRGTRKWGDDVAMDVTPETKENKEMPSKPKSNMPALGDALFGANPQGGGSSSANPFSSNANPFSTSSGGSASNPFSSSASQNPFSSTSGATGTKEEDKSAADPAQPLAKSFAETLSLNTEPAAPPPPAEPWPEATAQPNPYPTLYLAEAEFETLDPTPTKMPENVRIEDTDAAEPSALDREAFESTMDAAFQKFADRMAQNPDQVIRYEFGGTPLLYSKTDAVGDKLTKSTMPGCPNCGGKRTFEVQLTPNAIAELEADDLSLEGMEWGTIIVGVCERSCLPRHVEKDKAGYLEEWAGVQWEELAKNK